MYTFSRGAGSLVLAAVREWHVDHDPDVHFGGDGRWPCEDSGCYESMKIDAERCVPQLLL